MSSLVRNKPEIQEYFDETYRIMRMWAKGELHWRTKPRHLFQTISKISVAAAVISFDNRTVEFSGWINPYRRRKFENLKSGMPADYDIPF